MCSVTLFTLLAFVARSYGANEASSAEAHKNKEEDFMDLDKLVQNLVDKLGDRANTHFQNADMDATTLGKAGNLAAAPSWSHSEEATEGTPSDQPHAFLIEDVIEPTSDGTLVEEETVLPLVLGLRGGAKKAPMAKTSAMAKSSSMKAAPMAKMAAMAKAKKSPTAKSSSVGMMLGLEGGMAKKAPMAKTSAMAKSSPMKATPMAKMAAMTKAKKSPTAKSSSVGMMLGLEGGMAKKAPMAKTSAMAKSSPMKAAPMAKMAAMKAMKAPMKAMK